MAAASAPGHLGLAWRLAELDSHFGLAADLHVGAVADLAVQAGQELPAHGATLVRQVQPSTAAITGNRLALSLPRHLGLIEHHRGGWAAALQLGAEPDNSHAPILAHRIGHPGARRPKREAATARR